MVVKLLVVAGSANIKEVTLRRPRTVAGRKKGCKLRIRSELVSRIHCSLITDGSRLRIKDLGSSNGTYVNGLRITEAALNAGDVIQIGPVKFVVQIIGSGPAGNEAPGSSSPTTKLPDDGVVFFESDEGANDGAEQVIEADLLEHLDDEIEFVTEGEGHQPVAPAENIFGSESQPPLDAGQIEIPDDGNYGLADSNQRKGPKKRH
jgi:predicted component of type VI protein secretion system